MLEGFNIFFNYIYKKEGFRENDAVFNKRHNLNLIFIVKHISYIIHITCYFILVKYNIITCIKVTGEIFSFYHKEKKSRRERILKVSKFSGKRTVTR